MVTAPTRSWIWAGLLLLVATVLLGCGREENSPATTRPATTQARAKVVIGYSAPEWGGGQYLIMEGLRDRAKAKGWDVTVLNANFDPEVQARQIDYLVEQKVNAIVAVPLDSQKIGTSIAHAREQGALFYTIDRAPSAGMVNMVVQADNRLAGRQAGEALIAALQSRKWGTKGNAGTTRSSVRGDAQGNARGEARGDVRGTVLELQGELTQTVALERGQGFHEALRGHPGIRVIQKETHWQAGLFANLTREALAAEPVDAIYLHSDMIGIPEVLPVLRQMDRLFPRGDLRHIIIVGVDGGPPGLQGIRDGVVDCLVSQPLTDYGIVVDYIERELRGEKITAGVVTHDGAPWSPARIVISDHGPVLQMRTITVTQDNVDDPSLWGNQFDRAARKLRRN